MDKKKLAKRFCAIFYFAFLQYLIIKTQVAWAESGCTTGELYCLWLAYISMGLGIWFAIVNCFKE